MRSWERTRPRRLASERLPGSRCGSAGCRRKEGPGLPGSRTADCAPVPERAAAEAAFVPTLPGRCRTALATGGRRTAEPSAAGGCAEARARGAVSGPAATRVPRARRRSWRSAVRPCGSFGPSPRRLGRRRRRRARVRPGLPPSPRRVVDGGGSGMATGQAQAWPSPRPGGLVAAGPEGSAEPPAGGANRGSAPRERPAAPRCRSPIPCLSPGERDSSSREDHRWQHDAFACNGSVARVPRSGNDEARGGRQKAVHKARCCAQLVHRLVPGALRQGAISAA